MIKLDFDFDWVLNLIEGAYHDSEFLLLTLRICWGNVLSVWLERFPQYL